MTSTVPPTTLRSWNVNGLDEDLLNDVILSWEKTLNTSRRKTAHLRNWNVSDLPMDREDRRHEFRLFHQLIRHLLHRETLAPAMTARRRDLGHYDSLVRGPSVDLSERLHQLVHPQIAHLWHRSIENLDPWAPRRAPRCAAGPAPAAHTARPDRPAATRSASSSSNSRKNAGGGGVSVAVAPRTRSCAPPPRPLPSSDLLRCGAGTRQGPWRSTAARASRQRAVVALFATVRLPWRVRHPS